MKALKITKGKPFDSGVVFIDGKFVEPPYVVERYGNVIRINGVQVTQPVIEWSEFLKTQSGLTVVKTEAAPAAEPAPEPEPEPVTSSASDDSDDPLDDLFDDAPAKPKKTSHRTASFHAPAPKPAATSTTVKFDGVFEMNDRARGLVSKINLKRTEIDAALRRGGFFSFGSSYSTVSGDKALASRVMSKIPLIMKGNSEPAAFAAAVRSAGFVYFPPRFIRDLYKNRLDYLVLQKRWKKMQEKAEMDAMLERAGSSSF